MSTTTFRAACIQPNTGPDWQENFNANAARIRDAVADGASIAFTPEVSNFLFGRRKLTVEAAKPEAEDPTLAATRDLAAELGIWINIGSLALAGEEDDRLINRSFLIAPNGDIANRYDKIHMFDVVLPSGQKFTESRAYRPGEKAGVVETPLGRIGMTICYDLRFPGLYRDLAQAGAEILTVPSAFTAETGKAHWHILLQARAIETGCYVIAAAQTGTHQGDRQTYGHSLIIDPWGKILADAGEETGWVAADIDLSKIEKARQSIPSLNNGRDYELTRT